MTDQAQHTPGPLSVMDGTPEHYQDVEEGDDFYIVRIQDHRAAVHGQAWGYTPGEAMANGNLWSAAPELLAWAQNDLINCTECRVTSSCDRHASLRAIVAKAEGRQS